MRGKGLSQHIRQTDDVISPRRGCLSKKLKQIVVKLKFCYNSMIGAPTDFFSPNIRKRKTTPTTVPRKHKIHYFFFF